ncbi:MAG: hypothetical protein IJJ26_07210, partial [Victivallales bacterium]|nr:hypothetical protein [Victivallales bacterium]
MRDMKVIRCFLFLSICFPLVGEAYTAREILEKALDFHETGEYQTVSYYGSGKTRGRVICSQRRHSDGTVLRLMQWEPSELVKSSPFNERSFTLYNHQGQTHVLYCLDGKIRGFNSPESVPRHTIATGSQI